MDVPQTELPESKIGSQMGLWMTGALVVGTMIGSGIFMLPVALAPLGVNALAGWAVSATGALCIAFALARLSHLGGEGIQANIARELGPTPAFLAAWAFWVSSWVAQAAVALAAASALSWLGPALTGPRFVAPAAIAFIVALTALNGLGARASGGMAIVTVAIKLLPLLAVIAIFALATADGGTPLEPFAPLPLSLGAIASAATLTLFALTGFENATTPVGKVRDPARTIPLAILGGTALVAIIYVAASTGVQRLLPATVVAQSAAPIAEAIGLHWGNAAASLAAVGIAVAAFGGLNSLILGTGELGYAMAIRHDLPRLFAATRGKGTPVNAQLLGLVLSVLLILANSSKSTAGLFTFIVLLSTSAALVVYLAGTLAAWRLCPAPLARAVLTIALGFIVFATYGSGLEADVWCLVLLAIGYAIRFVVHRAGGTEPSSAPI